MAQELQHRHSPRTIEYGPYFNGFLDHGLSGHQIVAKQIKRSQSNQALNISTHLDLLIEGCKIRQYDKVLWAKGSLEKDCAKHYIDMSK